MRLGKLEVEPGLQLYYRVVGDGPQTVVVPAGFFLENVLDELAEDRTLIFYDMRDRGRSDAVQDRSRIGIQEDLADLEAVRAHFGVQEMSLVGWSYLGMMVAMYAFQHPQHLERIIQVGPIPPRAQAPYQADADRRYQEAIDPKGFARLQQLAESGAKERHPEQFYRAYWQVFKPILFGDRGAMERYQLPPANLENEWLHKLEPHFQAKFDSFGDYDWRDEAAKLQLPVLTVHGTLDRNAPFEGGLEWAAAFANARLLRIEGAGHLPMVEQPALVLPAMDEFLKGDWPEAATTVVES